CRGSCATGSCSSTGSPGTTPPAPRWSRSRRGRDARPRAGRRGPEAIADTPVDVAARRKLIVVSNRGPVSYGRDAAGERVARRGGGGLVTALRGLVRHQDVTWIA